MTQEDFNAIKSICFDGVTDEQVTEMYMAILHRCEEFGIPMSSMTASIKTLNK